MLHGNFLVKAVVGLFLVAPLMAACDSNPPPCQQTRPAGAPRSSTISTSAFPMIPAFPNCELGRPDWDCNVSLRVVSLVCVQAPTVLRQEPRAAGSPASRAAFPGSRRCRLCQPTELDQKLDLDAAHVIRQHDHAGSGEHTPEEIAALKERLARLEAEDREADS